RSTRSGAVLAARRNPVRDSAEANQRAGGGQRPRRDLRQKVFPGDLAPALDQLAHLLQDPLARPLRRLPEALVDEPHDLDQPQRLRAVAEHGLHLAHSVPSCRSDWDSPRSDSARSIRIMWRAFSSATGPSSRPTTISTTTRRTPTGSLPQYSLPSFTLHAIAASSAHGVGLRTIPSAMNFSCRVF